MLQFKDVFIINDMNIFIIFKQNFQKYFACINKLVAFY